MLPKVTILLVTYDRPIEIRKTIDALIQHIKYDGELNWHIADDSTGGNYIEKIFRDYPKLNFTATVTKRAGWGANVNKALSSIKNDFIFLCEDDYVALKDIQLNHGVALLSGTKELGEVRYDGIAGHVGLVLELKEFHSINYLVIDKEKSSHFNVYSNRPHLRHRRFHDLLGMYPEGISLGETETSYAGRVKNAIGYADVAILSNGVERAFEHIGKTRQGTEQDVGFHSNL